ncbi:HD domain-containing protein [Desulfurispirillum indicum]|uniref:Metal-dependent phosphohydrolase HD sub domain n=1 Tax=Desulfurispirillum indicum (strain ATCC BAA-1389 / DSM 22839 / S5) TaxID=653733 RepID=E6W099_DESIS|nr:HD domain-containing phosphohydrolase [Desulfurispirillum indicum]ADU66317.1 metal-dependent phosphohydrolase HD sub domain [Desulfurispirillum indicum S5]UCZ55650.1 HD domain-containing protein [Desulfurispirillum indicum]
MRLMHDYHNQFDREPGMKRELSPDQMLKVIFEYVAKISNEKQVDRILMLMADMGRQLVVADRCTLWLLDEQSGELWTKVAHGIPPIRIPAGTGVVGHSMSSGEDIIINDAYADARFNQEVDKQTGYRTRNIIALPIRNNDGDIIGAYQAINKLTSQGYFTDKDREHLGLAASYSGKALESALLYQEIEDTQKEIIFTMAEVGESRSKETGNHVKRVAEYSYVLARGMNMDEREREILRMASPMHDIGKIGIPDAILKKPGKLTDEEFNVIKSHSTMGYEMLRKSRRSILKAAATVAHEHHEKFNGRGYPRGLAGEEIHLFGRITALADVFDALGSDRVYKAAWPLERILNLFKEERGQHFDPNVVDAFFENLKDILEIRDTFQDTMPESSNGGADQ